MCEIRLKRVGSNRINRDRAGRRIERIGSHEFRQPTTQLCLPLAVEFFVVGTEFVVRPAIENEDRFAMQPIGRPVGSDITSVPPDRTDFHPAHRLPDVLASLNLPRVDDDLAIGRHDLVRNRRSFLINPPPNPAEDSERHDQNHAKKNPKSLHVIPRNSNETRLAAAKSTRHMYTNSIA